jgi:hypothetical protein
VVARDGMPSRELEPASSLTCASKNPPSASLAGQECTQELRVVRRGLEESCARLAGKGWPSVARTAERVREALRGLGGSVEVESYRGTSIERRGKSVSTASDTIYRACPVRPQCPLVA